MKNFFIFFAFFISVLYAAPVELSKEEKDYIASNKPIKLHNEMNWPPYNFNIDGVPKGFSIDYMNLLSQKVGMEIEYVSGKTWDEFMEMLKNDEIDSIINISKNKQRSEFFNFTSVFHTAANAIYVENGNEHLDSLKKLEGKTIVMPKGFFAQQLLEKYYPKIKQIHVKDSLEALRLLSLGKADATVGKKNVLDYIISTRNISGVVATNYVDDNRLVSLVRMATNKNNPILASILEKGQKLISDEELLNLKRKWFGSNDFSQRNIFTPEEKKYLDDKYEIKMCTVADLKPIEFTEDTKLKGISVDIIKLIEEKINKQFEIIYTRNLEESIDFLKNKRCDMISNVSNTNGLIDIADITKPLLNYKLAIITQKGNAVVQSIEDIIDQRIAINKNSILIPILISNYPDLKILETNSDYETLEAVNSGKVFFAIEPLPVVTYYMSKFALNNIFISRYTNMSFTSSIAVSNENKLLLDILNKSIENISEDEYTIIHNKWTNLPIKEPFDYTLLWNFLILGALILSILSYRQYILNKHNKKLQLANEEIELKTKQLEQLAQQLEEKIKIEIKKNEEKTTQLIQQSRLAQMGEMISMIAHQWRQPLAAISATTNNLLLKQILNENIKSDELKNELALINDYSQHLSSTIDDFRNFFKKDKTKEEISLEKLITKSLKIIKTSFDSKEIELIFDFKFNKNIQTYPTEVQQVILNILKNSEDILLEKKINDKVIYINTYKKDNFAVIEISDNGGGIDTKIIDKIFDPYFSTKKSKEGSGLGLYMSKTIINEHCNGQLLVDNGLYGAVFSIYLPVSEIES